MDSRQWSQLITFMTDSAKRLDLLTHTEANADSNTTHKLIKLCQTRFVERHMAVERFWEQIPSIAEALEMMQAWKDRKTSSKATTMLNSLLRLSFLLASISFSILLHIFDLIMGIIREGSWPHVNIGQGRSCHDSVNWYERGSRARVPPAVYWDNWHTCGQYTWVHCFNSTHCCHLEVPI